MSPDKNIALEKYNKFCRSLHEGCILYNIDSLNLWGEYLLVVNISPIEVEEGITTYSVLLVGLKKHNDSLIPCNIRINLTPDYAGRTSFLKYVGYCKFNLNPEISSASVNFGLVNILKEVDLKKYAKNLSVRKQRKRKYDKNGELVIKKTSNE